MDRKAKRGKKSDKKSDYSARNITPKFKDAELYNTFSIIDINKQTKCANCDDLVEDNKYLFTSCHSCSSPIYLSCIDPDMPKGGLVIFVFRRGSWQLAMLMLSMFSAVKSSRCSQNH